MMGTLDGFVRSLNAYHDRHGLTAKQWKYLKFGLARLAKEHPEADPRVVILEWFSEHIYAYEQYLERHNRE